MSEIVQKPANKLARTTKLIIIGGVLGFIVLVMGYIGIMWYLDLINYVTTEDARVSSDNISATSKIPGKVKALLVKQGDTVKKGQILIQLDNDELKIALNQAKSNLDMASIKQKQAQEGLDLQMLSTSSQIKQAYNSLEIAKAKLDQAEKGSRPEELKIDQEKVDQEKISLDKARDTFEKNAQLYQAGALSDVQYKQSADDVTLAEKSYNQAVEAYNIAKEGPRDEDKAILQKQVSQADAAFVLASAGDRQTKLKMYDLKAAEVAVKQAQYAVDLATLNYDNSFIKSPCDGVVGLKSINAGEMVSAGQSLLSVLNLGSSWISANIKETDVGKIKIGDKVQLFMDVEKGKKYQGEVYEIGSATNSTFSLLPSMNTSGNFTKVVQLIPVKIKIVNADKSFKVGSSVKIKIKR